MRVRKKPVEVEAWLFDRELMEKDPTEYPMVLDKALLSGLYHDSEDRFLIPTLEGDMIVRDGDYIIKGVQGEYYAVKHDIFHETYDIIGEPRVEYIIKINHGTDYIGPFYSYSEAESLLAEEMKDDERFSIDVEELREELGREPTAGEIVELDVDKYYEIL